jgi:rod shape-determining protein MreC
MKKRLKFLIIALSIVSVFFLINKFANDFIKNGLYKISAPLQKIAWQAGDWVSNGLVLPFRLDNLRLENQQLVKQNLLLKEQIIALKSQGEENIALRAALKIADEQKFQLILADVLSQDPPGNFLTINKGEKDGLVEGSAVITAEGALVGRVEKALNDFSQVLLITAKDSSFDIEIQNEEKSILAVAKGGDGQSLFFELVPQDVVIKIGDLVKTTNLSGKFPKNIMVGEVAEFQKGDASSFQRGKILPYFLKSAFNQLFVITNP